jgi:hypothetical protein
MKADRKRGKTAFFRTQDSGKIKFFRETQFFWRKIAKPRRRPRRLWADITVSGKVIS